jgi:hypothetical protein
MSSVLQGALHIHAAFDIGFEINFQKLSALLEDRLKDRARKFRPVSVSINREIEPLRIGFEPLQIEILGAKRSFQVFATFFELGALSLEFACELDGDFHHWPQISEELEESEDLADAAKALAREIFEFIRPALTNPDFYPHPSIHSVFNVRKLEKDLSSAEVLEQLGPSIAKILKTSSAPIGLNEVKRTLASNVTYSDNDIVFVSSKTSVVFDEDSLETIDILELANVQALELHFTDARLDRTLLSLYEDEIRNKSRWTRIMDRVSNRSEKSLRKLNTIHLDSVILAERVDQSFKLASDSYLARIHELCVSAMFLALLAKGIDGKLVTIRDIMNDVNDRGANARMETLEWIIIILILIGTVPIFLGK